MMIQQQGLSMIEVLIALAIFAFGILGTMFLNGNIMHSMSDNNMRVSGLQVVSQEFEPLVCRSNGNAQALKDIIDAYDQGAGVFQKTVQTNNDKDDFTVAITAAQDDSGRNLLTTADPVADWVSPITFGVSVRFTAVDGTTKTDRASYTFITHWGANSTCGA